MDTTSQIKSDTTYSNIKEENNTLHIDAYGVVISEWEREMNK